MHGKVARLSGGGAKLGRCKVIVPKIDIDRIASIRLLAPQFACIKAHRIYVLRLFTQQMRVRIREDEDAVVTVDRSDLAARITRQARDSTTFRPTSAPARSP